MNTRDRLSRHHSFCRASELSLTGTGPHTYTRYPNNVTKPIKVSTNT